MFKIREDCDTYLTHVYRHQCNIESLGFLCYTNVYKRKSGRYHSHSSLLFNVFYHFTFPGLPFLLIKLQVSQFWVETEGNMFLKKLPTGKETLLTSCRGNADEKTPSSTSRSIPTSPFFFFPKMAVERISYRMRPRCTFVKQVSLLSLPRNLQYGNPGLHEELLLFTD